MDFKNLILEKDGKIAVLTINRPNALNALNSELLKELDSAIDCLSEDDEVLAVVLTGAGKALSRCRYRRNEGSYCQVKVEIWYTWGNKRYSESWKP